MPRNGHYHDVLVITDCHNYAPHFLYHHVDKVIVLSFFVSLACSLFVKLHLYKMFWVL